MLNLGLLKFWLGELTMAIINKCFVADLQVDAGCGSVAGCGIWPTPALLLVRPPWLAARPAGSILLTTENTTLVNCFLTYYMVKTRQQKRQKKNLLRHNFLILVNNKFSVSFKYIYCIFYRLQNPRCFCLQF